jgi:hypothetical protein
LGPLVLIDDLRALSTLPGAGSAFVAVARSQLGGASRQGRSGDRLRSALDALAVADDPSRPPAERREAAIRALLALSCAHFWACSPGSCHEQAEAWDRARVVTIRDRLGVARDGRAT